MSKLSLDRFLALVERSKLIDPAALSSAVEAWKRQATLAELDDAAPCAERLVELGLLSRWQSRKLAEGRHRGFFLGNYKLLDHVGTGGMSSVYLAEHVRLRRRAAIKILPHRRAHDPEYLERFHVEGRAIAALDHPNIVRVYDLDEEGSLHYLVMEYIEGRDLSHLVEQEGPLDFHTAADYCAQAAAGLEHAHAAGLVHRDIKPANLLVDLAGTVKILDMGLAMFADDDVAAAADQVLGTADYLAPEQAKNSHSVDHRADLYALGCTFYYLVSGHPPFASGTSVERVSAHQRQQPPSLLVDRPDLPSELLSICQRLMEKSPQARFQTAADVKAALTQWLAGEAAAGRHPTPRRAQLAHAAGSGARQSRAGHTESRINLISGSAADLGELAREAAERNPSLTDTEVNLSRVTLPMGAGSPELSSGLMSPPPPPDPPSAPVPPAAAVRVRPLVESEAALVGGADVIAPLAIDERHVYRMLKRGRARSAVWWLVAASAAIAGATIWALLATAH